jgi:hypothetical protein
MQNDTVLVGIYRILFILGGILVFMSCFIGWYYVKVVNEEGQLVLECSYHLFLGWNVVDHIYPGALSELYPKTRPMSNEFLFFYIGIIVVSVYAALFKGSTKSKKPQKSKYTAYFLLTAIILVLVMISYFSFGIIFKDEMHVPALMINDQSYEIVLHQSIGMGFILHLIAFLFMFPLTWFHFRMNAQFEIIKEDQVSQSDSKVTLNLDQLIAEEFARSKELEKDIGVISTDYKLRRFK